MEPTSNAMKTIFTGSCIGMQYRTKKAIDALIGDEDCSFKISIIPEPENTYNPKAVGVWYANTYHVGYIPDHSLEETHEFLKWMYTVEVVSIESQILNAKMKDGRPLWFEFQLEVLYV